MIKYQRNCQQQVPSLLEPATRPSEDLICPPRIKRRAVVVDKLLRFYYIRLYNETESRIHVNLYAVVVILRLIYKCVVFIARNVYSAYICVITCTFSFTLLMVRCLFLVILRVDSVS